MYCIKNDCVKSCGFRFNICESANEQNLHLHNDTLAKIKCYQDHREICFFYKWNKGTKWSACVWTSNNFEYFVASGKLWNATRSATMLIWLLNCLFALLNCTRMQEQQAIDGMGEVWWQWSCHWLAIYFRTFPSISSWQCCCGVSYMNT